MNGLKPKTVETKTEPIRGKITDWGKLENILKKYFAEDGFIVVYLHYKVLVGQLTNGKPAFCENETFNPKHLLKLRVFNKKRELFIWQGEDCLFSGRLRVDNGEQIENEDSYNVVEAEQVLWGTDYKISENGWIRLFEKRGTELILPPNVKIPDKISSKNRVKIKMRYYVGFNEMGQAGYDDCRFVEFTGAEG